MPALLGPARAWRRHWILMAISSFSLALAMALGVLGLSISNTILILPPSAPAPDRLVMIYDRSPAEAIGLVSYPDYQYFRAQNHVFGDIAAAPNSIGLRVDFQYAGREVRLVTRPVSENYFAVMAIRPFLGRFFAPGDDKSQAHIAVMTYSCWQRLGSDPKIVGKVLAGTTILGVTPPSFSGSFYGINGDLFTTFLDVDNNSRWFSQRDARHLVLTARLKPGATRRQARAEMAALSGQLASAFPKENKDHAAMVTRATLLPPDAIPSAELMSGIVMTLVLLVLIIACANVANLMLAVAVGRRQESAIKLALGAPRGRLIREFLRESMLLSILSGAIGFGIAALVIAKFSTVRITFPMYGEYSFGAHLRLDATVVGLALLLIAIASLATGLAPALYASSPRLASMLSGEIVVGGTRKRLRRSILVAVQVATCTLVLIGMGLCQRNLYNLRHVDPGFSARNLIAGTIYVAAEGYSEARGKIFYDTLLQTVGAIPGVEAVALSRDLPLFGAGQIPLQIPDSMKTTTAATTVVNPDYFSTFGIPILGGRVFRPADREGTPEVVVINRKLAEMFWPGKDAIGKTLMAGNPARKVTVIGVAENGKYEELDENLRPFVYFALAQSYQPGINVIARTKGDPNNWTVPLAKALRGLGLKVMIEPVTLQSWMNLSLIMERIIAGAVTVLSGLGLLLAVLGLFGAISYSVSERKKELGIRVALGARPAQLLQMILRQTMWIAGSGVVAGTILGVVATVLFRSQLYNIRPVEWTVLLPVGAAMLAVALLVAYFSARAWIRIDPMEAVRHA